MIGTFECVYETPCHWCSKWDKKCDRKIPERGQRVKINPIDDATDISLIESVKMCESEFDYDWEVSLSSDPEWKCRKCGQVKYK